MQDSSRKHPSYETGYVRQFPLHRRWLNHSPENASSWKRGPGWCHTDSPQSSADMAHLPHSSRSEQGCSTKTFSIYSPEITVRHYHISNQCVLASEVGVEWYKKFTVWQPNNPISTIREGDEIVHILFIKQTS